MMGLRYLVHFVILTGFMLVVSCSEGYRAEKGAAYLLQESWDGRNAPSLFGNLKTLNYDYLAQQDFLSGSMPVRPWSDDYWPLQRAGIAWRWMQPGYRLDLHLEEPDYQQQIFDIIKEKHRSANEYLRSEAGSFLAPSEKYDLLVATKNNAEVSFPFTDKELTSFGENFYRYESAEISWGWMGHCHGWAAANLLEPAPKHPVLAVTPYGEVGFSVGDVRALLTRAYSENQFDKRELFLGDRCNRASDEIIRDSQNRVLDGVLGQWQDGVLSDASGLHFVYNNWRFHGHNELLRSDNFLVFRYAEADEQLFWARAVEWTNRQKEIVRVEVGRFNSDEPQNLSDHVGYQDFQYLKACRDLNAGAFHVALARLMSTAAAVENDGKPVSFILDVENGLEVWNQPLYSFRSQIGELTPLDDASLDPFAAFRAEDAHYIAHVVTEVTFGIEHGPLVIYREQDDRLASLIYQYSLEFDADRNVVGGEWLPASHEPFAARQLYSGDELFTFLHQMVAASGWQKPKHPDFIWRYLEGTRLSSRCSKEPCLNIDLIQSLAGCSRSEPDTEMMLGGRSFPTVSCEIAQ